MGCGSSVEEIKRANKVDKNLNIFQNEIENHDKKNNSQTKLLNIQTFEDCTASTDNINYFYDMIKMIGHGSFGTVRLAKTKNSEYQKVFAIKTVSKERVKDKIEVLKRELKIMQMLDHPNIIKFYEIFQDNKYLHYVMEYCNGGDLLNHVIKQGYLEEDEAARLMYKLCSAVSYMHSLGIIHRDLKPENVLYQIDKQNFQEGEIKLIDFGLSTIYVVDNNAKKQTYVGTPLYVAPEIVENLNYDFKVDCWSLGVILFIMLSGKQPFEEQEINCVYDKILQADYDFLDQEWTHVSKEGKNLVKLFLTVDTSKRISAAQALEHKWFKVHYLAQNKKKYEKKLSYMQPVLENLMHYHCENSLKKEALKIIVNHELKQSEIQHLLEEFKALDNDKNGEIGFYDIINAMNKQGLKVQESEIIQIFKEIHNNNKTTENIRNPAKLKINYSEFLTAAIDLQKYLNIERMWSIFQHFDPDNRGFITLEDIKEVAAKEGRVIDEKEIEELTKEIGDKLDFDHFCRLINPNISLKSNIDTFKKQLIERKK